MAEDREREREREREMKREGEREIEVERQRDEQRGRPFVTYGQLAHRGNVRRGKRVPFVSFESSILERKTQKKPRWLLRKLNKKNISVDFLK